MTSELRAVVGSRIWGRRLVLGMSQQELANAVGTSRQAIGELERGERSFSDTMLERIAGALDCTALDLTREDGIP